MPKRTRSHGQRPGARRPRKRRRTGRQAHAGRRTLRSERIGALPILNHFITRLRLEQWLDEHLPPEDKRVKVPATKALLVLVRNLLIAREPLYGIGEWAAGYAPDLLGLTRDELEALSVAIEERVEERYRQVGRGRPTKDTRYVKKTSTRFDLSYRIDSMRIAEDQKTDGVFPLVTNVLDLSEREVLLVYKRQPVIEKRFSQLKTDFRVAPVYLKDVSRIQALLCVYFLVLLVEALLERELRQAMEREGLESLPLYPENRPCRRPTARRVIDLFDDIHRHTLREGPPTPTVFVTERSGLQRRILKLLGVPATAYRA